jgi:uncharacterized protein (TIGR02246 family)
MSLLPIHSQGALSRDEIEVQTLYRQLLDAWNRRNADDFAGLFEENGNSVGFDGSLLNGRVEIGSSIRQIFTDQLTAVYVGKIKEVRFLTPDVAILRAICGMVPPGKSDLNPAVNAIQTLIARKQDNDWQIVHFQNTPAQFHGRPELVEKMTEDLRQLL